MKKNLLFSPILFGSILFHTACVNKDLTPIINESPRISDTTIEAQTTVSIVAPSIEITTPHNSTSGSKRSHKLTTVQGQTISVEELHTGFNFPDYKGKIILLQIFGKECKYCFQEMPIIARINAQYSNEIQIIALQAQDQMSQAKAQELIMTHNMNYPIIDRNEAGGLLSFITKKYEWPGILPYVMLIKDGVTQYSFGEGGVSYEELEESIKDIL